MAESDSVAPSRSDWGALNPLWLAGPVTLRYKKKVTRLSSPCSPKPIDKTLTDLEGAQPVTGRTPPTSLESSALPPPSLLPRRRRHRPRRRRAVLDISAPLVAAFEWIFITEPEMASSSSSSGGGEGPLPSVSLSLCVYSLL